MAFSADGKHLLIGLRTGELTVHDFEAPTEFVMLPAHTAWVTCIALAPNGRTFVTSSSGIGCIGVWDAATFTNITRLRGHVGEALCAAISPDGQTIISGGSNGRPWEPRPVTKLWRLNDRRDKPFPQFRTGRRLHAQRAGPGYNNQ